MNRNVWSARLYKLATFLVVMGMLVAGVSAPALAADEPAGDDGGNAQAAAANFSVGNGEREVAAYWQDYYDSSEGNLPNAQANVQGFYNTLRYHNWGIFGLPRWCNFSGHNCYIWSNSAVWEDDFVDNDNSYIDTVDLVFYEGHGWPGGFTVRPPDDYYVEWWEVQNRWGNVDLEYMMLLSCSVLADSNRANWYGAFAGLHLLAGFANTAYDVNGFGTKLATDIVWGYSYKDAWFRACDTHQPSGVTARILAEEYANYSESAYYSPYDFGVDPPKNGVYWWWDKACGAPTVSSLQPAQLGDQFPIFNTPPLSLDEADRTFNNLTDAFFGPQASAAATYTMIDNTRLITDAEGRTLEMENSTGQFYFFDPNKAFTLPVSSGVSGAAILTEEDARQIADTFLKQNNLMPADGKFSGVKPVTLTEAQATGVGAAQILAETLTTYEVIYSRYLSTTVTTVDAASGEARTEVVEIPVDGPGAKVKVYVSPASGGVAAASAAQENGAVVGAQGGWRKAEASVNAAGVQNTVTILPFDPVIKALFNDNFLEAHVAFTKVPFANPTKKEILSSNLSTYEESTTASDGQANLYPAYRLYARYEGELGGANSASGLAETVVYTDYTWIPANEQFMRPLAKIASHTDVSKPLASGATVTAEALDATTKLKDAGFDASLDFMMGTGPFTYKWYLNDKSTEIGSGKTLNYVLPTTSENAKEGLVTYKIILEVTDTGNNNTALNSAQASFDVTAGAPNYLPIIVKPQ